MAIMRAKCPYCVEEQPFIEQNNVITEGEKEFNCPKCKTTFSVITVFIADEDAIDVEVTPEGS